MAGLEDVRLETPSRADRDALLSNVTWPADVEAQLIGVLSSSTGGETVAWFRTPAAARALRDHIRDESAGEHRDLPELPGGLVTTHQGITVVFVHGEYVHLLAAPAVDDPGTEATFIAVARNWAARVTGAGAATAPPADPEAAASAEEEVRRTILAQHSAFLAGDAEGYCSHLASALRSVSDGCSFVPAGLEYQRRGGHVVETPEFLEVTIESADVAYAAVYQQRDPDQPGSRTPSDHQLTREDGVWRISLSRYRTEREAGPAKCFVGGSANDLC